MIAFGDAVVAIALTLLILPLADAAGSLQDHQSVSKLLHTHLGLIGSFFITFVLISRLWWVHYQVFESAVSYDGWILGGTLAWMLAIVMLPFGSRLVAARPQDRATIVIYVGSLLVASISLALLAWRFSRCEQLTEGHNQIPLTYRLGPTASSVCLAIVLIVGLISPPWCYWSMISLLLPSAALRIQRAHYNRRGANTVDA